jgi:hypothetical protein
VGVVLGGRPPTIVPDHELNMTQNWTTVTYEGPDYTRLPDWASAPLALLQDLKKRGVLEELDNRMRVHRKAGSHDLYDAVVFLVCYFASSLNWGLRPFWEQLRLGQRVRARAKMPTVQQQLASWVGRKTMCSSTALSGLLQAVDLALVRPAFPWLLVEASALLPLFQHPSVLTRDARGVGWHVFDLDPSVTPMILRVLAEQTKDRPAARRRAEQIAAPGYPGRKRSDAQFVRTIVSHAGLGAWIFNRVSSGNGDARVDLAAALDAILGVVTGLSHGVALSMTRLDGAYGGVPAMTALRERGLPFVTRLAHDVLNLPEVVQRLNQARWEFLPGAEIDGLRSAAELGMVTLQPAESTRRADGTPYEPIRVRLVVSRFRQTGAAGRGQVIEGWQYEVFAIDADAEAWPAAEAIALFNGRSACENRYAQEDRELMLDRLFSHTIGGQELVTTLGMFVWNLQIAHGFRIEEPDAEAVPLTPRQPLVDERASAPPTPVAESVAAEPPAAPSEPPLEPMPEPASVVRRDQVELRATLQEKLSSLPWDEMTRNRPGWTWDPSAGGLRCEDGQLLHLSSAKQRQRGEERVRLHFVGANGACRECPVRSECFASASGLHTKHVSFTVPKEIGGELKSLLAQLGNARPHRPRTLIRPATLTPKRPPSPSRGGHVVHPLDETIAPGPWEVVMPRFLPAKARQAFRDLARQAHFEITIDASMAVPLRTHSLIAGNARERRHGRMSWSERKERLSLPVGVHVSLTVRATRKVATALMGSRPTRRVRQEA